MVAMAGRCRCVSTTSVVSYFVARAGGGGGGVACGFTTTCVPGCGAGCGACCTSTVVEGGGGCCGCDFTVVVEPEGASTVVWPKAGATTSAHASTASLLAVTELLLSDVWVRDHADDRGGHQQAGTSKTADRDPAGGRAPAQADPVRTRSASNRSEAEPVTKHAWMALRPTHLVSRGEVGGRHGPVSRSGVDGSEGSADEEAGARPDGQMALPVVIVLEQRDARADGETGDAAVESVGGDDRRGGPGRLDLDHFRTEGVGPIRSSLRSGRQRRRGEQPAEHGD